MISIFDFLGKRAALSVLGAVVLVAVGMLGLRALRAPALQALAEEIHACNKADGSLRFSCYRQAIEKNYGQDFGGFVAALKSPDLGFESNDSSYANFGTNCHTFYHAVGDYVASQKRGEAVPELVKNCPTTCTSACVMGLYKRTALDRKYDEGILGDFWKDCPEGSQHQCSHEIGHLLHDKYTTSILKTIDRISRETYGLKIADAQYTMFEKPDLDAPFEDCKRLVPEAELPYCYTGIGHNLFLFAEFDSDGYKKVFDECETTAPENKDACYDFLVYRIGINEAAVKFLSADYEGGVRICEDVAALSNRPQLEKHCYLGIGGGIGLFVDSEYSHAEITEKTLALMQKDVLEKIHLCDYAKEEYQSDCYKGLLGTKVKKLYKQLNLDILIFEDIIPKIESDFEVVG